MAFFMSHSAYHPQASFTPLFRVVNNDRYSRCGGAYHFYRPAPRPWNPRFNVRETEDAYTLTGELPGLNKDHVTVEFPEPQKIVIRGKVERDQDAASQPTTQEERGEPSASSSATAATTQAASEDSSSTHSYQATVEDDDETEDFEVVEKASEKTTQDGPQRQLETEAEQQHQQQEHSAEEPQRRCRRGVREFTRTFTFPAHVDADFVTADLKDGLLSVVVPKAKPEPRHITIN
ncbi:unnamed protein product [Clonostachys chloroleuca]|uniref:SHSP domain-containing protein n=1 Tax=Clonostachys chloroleuca TaxID=1926264 RepID=A0AA35M4F9_9HYPO|nr:unnamed protein product [Clonostachys chloroleuca]